MIVCPKCSKENQDHYKFCLGCGSELPKDASPQGRAFSTPTPPAGVPVSQSSPDVAGGGPAPPAFAQPPPVVEHPAPTPAPAPISEPPPPDDFEDEQTLAPQAMAGMKNCPNCNTENPSGFKFCGACGARLDAESAAPAEPPPAFEMPAEGAEGYLVLIRPDGSEGGAFPLSEGSNTVGRDTDPIFEADAYLSPTHATFSLSGGRMTVHDEESLNGVFVRIPAEKSIQVDAGDVIRLGQELVMIETLPEKMVDDDGTELMGSVATEEIWGRASLIVGKDQSANAMTLASEGIVLGRERGDVLFPEDGYVSGTHLRIQRQGDQIVVTDLNSSNGTFLRVGYDQELQRGDYILMGQQLFRVDF